LELAKNGTQRTKNLPNSENYFMKMRILVLLLLLLLLLPAACCLRCLIIETEKQGKTIESCQMQTNESILMSARSHDLPSRGSFFAS